MGTFDFHDYKADYNMNRFMHITIYFCQNNDKLVKIQSHIKGYLARKKYKILKPYYSKLRRYSSYRY